MSKRQRPSSPTPIPPETQVEDESSYGEAYEPDTKRRRYFAPITPGDRHHISERGVEYDSEDSEVKKGRHHSNRGRTGEWQHEAGAYKDANSLLHDLHAEQRHRILFSSSSSSTAHITHSHPLPHPTYSASTDFYPIDTPHKIGPSLSSFPSPITGPVDTEMIEAATVTHHYEDSNRFLKSLFLNRRQELTTRPQS